MRNEIGIKRVELIEIRTNWEMDKERNEVIKKENKLYISQLYEQQQATNNLKKDYKKIEDTLTAKNCEIEELKKLLACKNRPRFNFLR